MTRSRERAIRDGLSIAGVILLVGLYWVVRDPGYDAYAYWRAARGDPYAVATGLGAFHYSPVALAAVWPLGALPWPVAYGVVVALSGLALAWLGRSWTLAWLAFFPVASELYHGNIDLILAAAIVAGFRWPAAWAVVLHAKVTPGIGLLWFAVRREWRPLVIAGAATVVVALPIVVLRPDLWNAWLAHLSATGPPAEALIVPVPLPARMAVAAVLVTWGARTDRRWTVLVAATIAQPILGIIGFSMLAALPRLLDRQAVERTRDLE